MIGYIHLIPPLSKVKNNIICKSFSFQAFYIQKYPKDCYKMHGNITIICDCLPIVAYCVVFLLCFSLSCVPYDASFFSCFVFLCLVYPPMMPVSLDCPFFIVPSVFYNVDSLSVCNCFCTLLVFLLFNGFF